MATALDQPMPITDLMDVAMRTDPYPRLAELRRTAPISLATSPLVRKHGYLAVRYDDVLAIHTDERLSSDMQAHGAAVLRFLPRIFRLLTDSMVFKDDPAHMRLRRLVSKAFTPRRVQEMEAAVASTVDDLVDRLARQDGAPVDLMDAFATPVPLAVIASMLGVSDRDRDEFHHGVRHLTESFSGMGPVEVLKAIPMTRRMVKLFDRLAEERRRQPDDHLISALVRAEHEGDRLTHDEVVAMIFLLLLAGHDTTANLIGNSVLALLDHPEQLALLRAEPELIDVAVEELLRFTSPVPVGTTRYALDDVELSGVRIPKGAQVLAMIASANRDEEVFERPDELDLTRNPNRHLAFAFGSHYCLGNQLARLEARCALGALVQRFEHIELATPRDAVRFKPTPALRGPLALPVRLR